jgi:ribosomal protein L11 methyltransferase
VSYYEFDFRIDPIIPFRDVVLAYIEDLSFDSFEEYPGGLKAYTTEASLEPDYVLSLLEELRGEASIEIVRTEIETKNWNEEWEKNFNPIRVHDQILIHAPFHLIDESFPHRIIIEPKMSFGTGHHSTTWLMCEMILGLDLKNKTVLDMGSGTGVLAILAEQRGASSVDAIDIDEWAFENCKENLERNGSSHIQAYMGNAELLAGKSYDIILANINRNILVNDQAIYSSCLASGGEILLSGFYRSDVPIILSAFSNYDLVKESEQNDWACLRLKKK